MNAAAAVPSNALAARAVPMPTPAPRPPRPAAPAAPPAPAAWRRHYVTLLGWAFTLFSSVRVIAYLPTAWAIVVSGDSSQHSLWTWCTWLGANLTMSLWLRERNGGRFCRAALVSLGNASMCALTLGLIVWFRL